MIQIYGAGIAGTYLYHLLQNSGFDVAIYDRRKEPDCRCAWGIIYTEAKRLYSRIGINLDEYVLLKPEYIVANGLWLKNRDVVIFDKKQLLSDLWDFEMQVRESELIVDATGVSRAFLPPLQDDRLLPTVQFVENHSVEENLYIQMDRTGYAWAFPLGDNRWHIGAGNVQAEKIAEFIDELRRRYGFLETESLCRCNAKIRLLQPSKCRPFLSGNVVGVGEAIGCVSGAGEGNVPALESARILYECIASNEMADYERRILEELDWIEIEQKFVDAMLRGSYLSALKHLPRIVSMESKRAVHHGMADIKKLLGL